MLCVGPLRMPASTQRRRRRRGPPWLLDQRGRPYRTAPGATAFAIHFQPNEGALWRRLTGPDGTSRTVPLIATRADLEAAVGRIAGTYSLVPIDQAGRQAGDPPQMIAVPEPQPPMARADQRTNRRHPC